MTSILESYFTSLQGKHIVVLGLGVSNRPLVRLLLRYGCTVTGCLELRAHDRMFGVAGVVGYGSGTVEGCTVDVTLICTDTDPNTKDEQFMAAVFSTAGHYLGSGMALKNGSKIVRPVIIVVLVLLAGKVLLELFAVA